MSPNRKHSENQKPSRRSPVRRTIRWVRRAVLFTLAAIGTAALIIAYFPLAVWLYSDNDETRDADAAIILGAAVYGDRPSPVFEERILHGIELYKGGRVKKLIFTGGRDAHDQMAEASAGKALATDYGVPESDIILEQQSTTTWGNLYYSKPLLAGNKITSVLIVSDPYHMRRAISMARHLGIQAYSSPTPTSRYRSTESQLEFGLHESALYASFTASRLIGRELRR